MRLVSVGVHGYKRFAGRSTLGVGGRVVAIVGPNEAGKTSLLNAMRRLTSSGSISDSEWTRDQPQPSGDVIWARFLIDESDRSSGAQIPGIKDAKWYVLYRRSDGVLRHRIEPQDSLQRDLGPRKRCEERLSRAAAHPVLHDPEQDSGRLPVAGLLSEVASELDSEARRLEDEVIESIDALASALEATALPEQTPKYIRELPVELRRLSKHESAEDPRSQALDLLDSRHPRFLLFGSQERDLRSDYDLNEAADDPPAALLNLTSLADLNLIALRDARVSEDYPRAEKLLEDANEQLRTRFQAAWQQSGVFIRLAADGTTLRVFVSSVGGYTDIAERSDGLLAFVALLTFTALHSSGRPVILLVDEAENHLHYDAQADLIRVFSQQEAAVKVIYTTHSAGCLPHDLASVRLVAAHDDGSSTIKNAYWSDGPGLTPLLVGMGASLLAFTPARRAVLAEGGADALLLPTLLREAAGSTELPFQIVPGLAEVSPAEVPSLDLEAAAVAYHVDGDKGGERILQKLARAGVPEARVVILGGPRSGLVVEDLVEFDLYLEAVNAVIERGRSGAAAIPAARLPDQDRPGAVRKWCSARGIAEPNKAAVVYELLELRDQGRAVLDSSRANLARDIYSAFEELLHLRDT